MGTTNDTQGDRIRALFESAAGEVAVIAPFIKVDALQSLLRVIPIDKHLRCVTRWLPREIAAGVSDPEILDMLEERGNFSLFLADQLHAKLYLAGDRCLAGSSNVTLAGLGEGFSSSNNIEVLVETGSDDPGIAATLEEILLVERPATKAVALAARRLADSLSTSPVSLAAVEAPWFPRSRRPERAYRFYTTPPSGFVGEADGILLADLANSNIQPGLEEDDFRAAVRTLLTTIPIVQDFLNATEDVTLTRADANSHLETIADEDISTNDLWRAFVEWMVYFFPDKTMKQEMAEIALRRARLLNS